MFSSSSDYINPFIPASSISFQPPPPPLPSHNLAGGNDVFLCNYQLLNSASHVYASPGGAPLLFGFASTNNINPAELPSDQAQPVTVKKKERHSKICTAQGVRDRRVRLSVEIAREFFNLQDMLGFDRASKTLEWLLGNSRNAINELTNANFKMKKRVPAAQQQEIQCQSAFLGVSSSGKAAGSSAATRRSKSSCRSKKMQQSTSDHHEFQAAAAAGGVEDDLKPNDPPIAHHQHLPFWDPNAIATGAFQPHPICKHCQTK